MDTPLPAEDRPVPPSTRRPSRGLLWAMALATVVLAIATIVAFTAGDGDDDQADKLDPTATQPPMQGEDVTGQQVPDIDFERFDGTVGAFSDYEGRPLVINFFASWCVPCVAEMPDFEQVHQANGDQVAFLGLNVTEQPESAQALIERTGITYDTGRDPKGELLAAFGGANMPTTVFVDANGTIVAVHTGKIDRAELEQILATELS